MMRSETCPDCPCPLTPPEVRKLWGPRSSTLLRSAANTSPARQVSPGRATSKASSESSTPRLRSFPTDRKSTRLNSSHSQISYAVFCLKKKKKYQNRAHEEERPGPEHS